MSGKTESQEDVLSTVPAIVITFLISGDTELIDEALLWEQSFTNYMKTAKFNYIKCSFSSGRALEVCYRVRGVSPLLEVCHRC